MNQLSIVRILAISIALLLPSLTCAQNTFDVCNAGSYPTGSSVVSDTGNTQIITGVPGKQTYICFLYIITGAQSVALVEGTGTTCGTSTVGMSGGATAATGWAMTAQNNTVSLSNANTWVAKTATAGDNVCLFQSASTQISGNVRYVQQ